jgi:hypothetical protein
MPGAWGRRNGEFIIGGGASGGGGAVTLGGDATGPSGANTVERIQGQPVESGSPSIGDLLLWDGAQWARQQFAPSAFHAHDNAGVTSIAGAYVDIPLDTGDINTGEFTHTLGQADVTYTGAPGIAVVVGHVSTIVTATTNRSQVDIKLQIDRGSGWVDLPGTAGGIYNRQLNYGGTASAALPVVLNTGDRLKMQAIRSQGTATITTLPGASGLGIIPLRGAQGVQGIPGSGSTVTVKNNGAPIGGGPHANLNFGPGITPSDAGGSEADVELDDRGFSFSAYTTADTIVGSGAGLVPIVMQAERVKDTPQFTFTAPGTGVTVTDTGRYQISGRATGDKNTGIGDVIGRLHLTRNGAIIPGCFIDAYHEDTFTPVQPYTIDGTNIDLNAGDVIGLAMQTLTGVDPIRVVAGTAGFNVERLRKQ